MSEVDQGLRRRVRPAPLDVEVVHVDRRAGGFVRVTFSGDALEAFVWPGPTSHLKFFPPSELMPADQASDGLAPTRPVSRTYTPRSFDASTRELVVDFLIHGDGPAATWALGARPGDRARVSVPRASYEPDPTASWVLLCADDSAVPALATMLDAGLKSPTTVMIETTSAEADRPQLPYHELASVTWVSADPANPGANLRDAIARWSIPQGSGAAWIAGEAVAVRAIRHDLLIERGLPREAIVTRGYWRKGAENHPDHDFGEDPTD